MDGTESAQISFPGWNDACVVLEFLTFLISRSVHVISSMYLKYVVYTLQVTFIQMDNHL